MEFHVSRTAREKYGVDELLFSYSGNVVFANVSASRQMAKRINDVRERDGEEGTVSTINGGALFAMGLIDELSHAMVAKYRREVDPGVLRDALGWFAANAEPKEVERVLLEFTERFPNVAVYRGEQTAAEWLAGALEGMEDGLTNREAATEELLLLWLANINPAFVPFRELFDDAELKRGTIYSNVISEFGEFIETRPPFGAVGTLLDVLKAPMLASPDSLIGQLAYIRENWAPQLGAELKRLLLATDVLSEEEIAIWMRFHPEGARFGRRGHAGGGWGAEGFEGDEFVGFGPGGRARSGSTEPPPLNEYEAFSQDQDWMPTVVLVAKSTYVWLEQLSQKYLRHIFRLDQIPQEELDLLASRGINGLWLIGLWERSVASQTIKRLRGQHDAVASAYSLKDYLIAADLGGNEAYEVLRDRAAKAGIRLASDMVPNHMGIDSTWVLEHPDWFISRGESPFPVYSFEGPDLSTEARFEIKIEDHYYDQTDAAVAFRLRERATGWTQFVYHGNDGTTFAWNDTAQLDYSKAYVREQVIQTILSVARQFPIIRFDAAMVLAKKHVQRLWFPLPGAGGSIPSRAENAMSQEEFDGLMPNEFWREVVDRVAVEVPGTLLLAEAFWLLEGYFVRTLGMHRVYNSAFMNMLRDEENAKYRSYLKKTIEFDPDILKRYVNFMSNPDERTTIDQFGSGDKCFGVATLLATLPGLPMFGHGQVEGFTEKYGMEYKQARMRETPNEELVARHQREIAPLLKRRWAFAESANFVLYDFWNDHGTVDENVFAYSNVSGGERSLVLYNNVYGSTRGTVHVSAASMDKGAGTLRQRPLVEAMQLPGDPAAIVGYRDTTSGLEYLRRAGGLIENGFSVELRGYQYVVLQQWREMTVTAEQPWDQLCDALHGAGVYNLGEALSKLRLRPVHDALRQMLTAEVIGELVAAAETAPGNPKAEGAPKPEAEAEVGSGKRLRTKKETKAAKVGEVIEARLAGVLSRVEGFFARAGETRGRPEDAGLAAGVARTERLRTGLAAVLRLPGLQSASPVWPEAATAILPSQSAGELRIATWATILAWAVLREMDGNGGRSAEGGTRTFDELQLRSALAEIFSGLGVIGDDAWRAAARVRVLLGYEAEPGATEAFWRDGDVRWLASANESGGATYLNKEAFDDLLWWLEVPALVRAAEGGEAGPSTSVGTTGSVEAEVAAVKRRTAEASRRAAESGYEVRRYVAAATAEALTGSGGQGKAVAKAKARGGKSEEAPTEVAPSEHEALVKKVKAAKKVLAKSKAVSPGKG
jgi:glycosidase